MNLPAGVMPATVARRRVFACPPPGFTQGAAMVDVLLAFGVLVMFSLSVFLADWFL